MLVDGNRENVVSFRAAVEKALPESEVFSVPDGVNNIDIIKKISPDVILIDSGQSSSNTLVISQIVKEDRDLQAIPILLITDLDADRQLRLKAIDAGVESFIFKPLDESVLITQLKTMLKVRERNMLILENKSKLEALVKSRTRKLRQEINEHIKSEESLKESEEKFRVYIEKAPIGVFISDGTGRYVDVNDMSCHMTGYTREELLQLSIDDLLFAEYVDSGSNDFSALKSEGFLDTEYNIRRKDGQSNWIRMIGVKINDNCIMAFYTDIALAKEREQKITYLSYHDALTGAFNRAFFEEEVRRQDTKQQLPFSLIMCDFNGLKLINDTLGHQAGDEVLIETVAILKRFARNNDIVSRVGGDEFTILLPKTTNRETELIGNRILKAFLEHKTSIAKQTLTMSISLGHATKTKETESFSCITKLAEDNMYRHKLLERSSYHSSFLESLKKSLFERSNETVEHANRLVALSRKISSVMNLEVEQSEKLELLATLHDIGKISIDNSILTKTGELNDEEWLEMKKHPSIGYRIAMAASDLKLIAGEILGHHERWDGNGYPQGISGENIPLLSRILSILDAYDAMTNDRPYRKALVKECALSTIEQNAGTQFDPSIVKIFLNMMANPDKVV